MRHDTQDTKTRKPTECPVHLRVCADMTHEMLISKQQPLPGDESLFSGIRGQTQPLHGVICCPECRHWRCRHWRCRHWRWRVQAEEKKQPNLEQCVPAPVVTPTSGGPARTPHATHNGPPNETQTCTTSVSRKRCFSSWLNFFSFRMYTRVFLLCPSRLCAARPSGGHLPPLRRWTTQTRLARHSEQQPR